ncbi:uncharacterized protein LOC136078252 [Hydra vulgaris]|uniref:Uncharacterized protein LOC136078252 n=1 Tax=Hydra vulgaris TaxID=6087 RepID=A0ABM4BKR1_HYDVU
MKNRITVDLLLVLLVFIICRAEKKYIKKSLADFHLTSVNNKRTNCVPLPFDKLMSQYKSWSGYNSEYLAATVEEAVLFPNLLWNNKDKEKYTFIINNVSEKYKILPNHNDPHSVLKFKNLVEMSLNLSISTSTGVTTGNFRRTNGRTVVNRFCTEVNYENPTTNLVNLCQQCSATTTQSDEWFPQYVNEVICGGGNGNNNGNSCFQNEGVCQQNTVMMQFLVKTNDCEPLTEKGNTVYVQKWRKKRQLVRTSCECLLKSNSGYRKLL